MESFLNRVFACCLYVSRSAWRSLSSPSARGKPSATRASIVSFTIPAPCALANAARMADPTAASNPDGVKKTRTRMCFCFARHLRAHGRTFVGTGGMSQGGHNPFLPTDDIGFGGGGFGGLPPTRPSSHARPRGYRRRRAGRLEKHRAKPLLTEEEAGPSKPAWRSRRVEPRASPASVRCSPEEPAQRRRARKRRRSRPIRTRTIRRNENSKKPPGSSPRRITSSS